MLVTTLFLCATLTRYEPSIHAILLRPEVLVSNDFSLHQAAKRHFTSFADATINAGWTLRDTVVRNHPLTARTVALEDGLLELEEAVARLWQVVADGEMLPPDASGADGQT
jgi:hypothetical protein